MAAPALRATWQRLDSERQEVQASYWKEIWCLNPSPWNAEDLDFAICQLLSVHRSATVVEWLADEPMSDEVVIQLLEALPADVAMSADSGPPLNIDNIAHLFEKLDQSGDVPDDVIAKLEVPYVGVPEFVRPNLALGREVTREPSLFADLMTLAFKRPDEQADEVVDEQTHKRRAALGYDILGRLHGLPGLVEDGSVDGERLSAWVVEARRLCKERGRGDIGDHKIGQILANAPVGGEGIWLCETVRDLLDDLASPHIGIGFTTGKHNLRGVTSRRVFRWW